MTNVNEMLADTLEALSDQVESDRMSTWVNRSAWLALVRHLAAQGLVNLQTLEKDLRSLGHSQPDEGWREGHEDYAGAVRLLRDQPSAAPQ